MLFKILGGITSLGNIAVIIATFYNETLSDFFSPHWNITVGSIFFLSTMSIFFFYLNNRENGINALKWYSRIYVLIALVIYSYWSFRNLYHEFSLNEFIGLFLLCSTLIFVSFLSIRSSTQENSGKILTLISSILSILTVSISFATIYKYVFKQAPVVFDDLLLEMFTILVGTILFLLFYNYGKKV